MKVRKNIKNNKGHRKIMRKKYKCSYCLKIFPKREIYELDVKNLFDREKSQKLNICSSCVVKENETFENE